MGKSSKDSRDIYYRQSKIDGYRARSAYKLLHLDEQFGFFGASAGGSIEEGGDVGYSLREQIERECRAAGKQRAREDEDEVRDCELVLDWLGSDDDDDDDDGEEADSDEAGPSTPSIPRPQRPTRAVDLCAAPGSWSQVLVQRLRSGDGARIVSVDLQPMAPIPGVTQVLGDITTKATSNAVASALAGDDGGHSRAQLIVCDGAPDVTGIHDLDEYLQAQLLLCAVQITLRLLEHGGTFIAKIFCQRDAQTGRDTSTLLVEQVRTLFSHVDVAKPRSSRAASHEHFIVCRNFQPPASLLTPTALNTTLHDLALLLSRRPREVGSGGGGDDDDDDGQPRMNLALTGLFPGVQGQQREHALDELAKVVGLVAGGDLDPWGA